MSNRYDDLMLYADNLQDELDAVRLKLEVCQDEYQTLEFNYDDLAEELERIPAWIRRFFK